MPAGGEDADSLCARLRQIVAQDSPPNTATVAKLVEDLKARPADEAAHAANRLMQDENFADTIFAKLARKQLGNKDDALCQWLYEWYLSGNEAAQLLVLRFVPMLLFHYLMRVSHNEVPPAGVEALLVGIYNFDALRPTGQSGPATFRMPTIAMPSPLHSAPANSTATTPDAIAVDPPPQPVREMNASNRPFVARLCLAKYAGVISRMPLSSRIHFCEGSHRLLSSGYPTMGIKNAATYDAAAGRRLDDRRASQSVPDPTLAVASTRSNPSVYRTFSLGAMRQTLKIGHKQRGPSLEPAVSAAAASAYGGATAAAERMWGGGERGGGGGEISPALTATSSFVQEAPHAHVPRVPLDPPTMTAMLVGLAHCLAAPQTRQAAQAAIDAAHGRAAYDLLPDVLLTSSALLAMHGHQ